MNKKAISPLISTILLILLAASLGGVVISWGKANYELNYESYSTNSCNDASLKVISFEGLQQVCIEENNLSFIIENNGGIDLIGVKISILNSNYIFSKNIYSPLSIAEIKKINVPYKDIAKIRKVIIVPIIKYAEKEIPCPIKEIELEKIREC